MCRDEHLLLGLCAGRTACGLRLGASETQCRSPSESLGLQEVGPLVGGSGGGSGGMAMMALEPSLGPLRLSGVLAQSVSFWILVPARVFTDCGCQVHKYTVLLEMLGWLTRVSPTGTWTLQADCGCEETRANYRALSSAQGAQMGLSPAWPLCQQACSRRVAGRGLELSRRPFKIL